MAKSTTAYPLPKVPPTFRSGSGAKKAGARFPLFSHASGRWAKKVRCQFAISARLPIDPCGQAAVDLWLEQRDI